MVKKKKFIKKNKKTNHFLKQKYFLPLCKFKVFLPGIDLMIQQSKIYYLHYIGFIKKKIWQKTIQSMFLKQICPCTNVS